MSNRRTFIRQSVIGSVGLMGFNGFPLDVFAKEELVKITILSTNDVHSHIEPFPMNDPKYAGLGGVSRRAAIIKKIRNETPNVLLLDAGDSFQGTPYFNFYGGELEFKLMSEMGYDASTIGNHDFDNGVTGLAKAMPHAKFPMLCANYDFSDTEMNGKTEPHKIFMKNGIKIGVFGIGIELEGLVDKRMYGKTIFIDPMEMAEKTALYLKKEMNCDLVICLSHLGYKYESKKLSDIIFAESSKNIDFIIGGHTHTFLDKPSSHKNAEGKEVLVSQVGWAGLRLGKVDYYFQKGKNKKVVEGSSMTVSENIFN